MQKSARSLLTYLRLAMFSNLINCNKEFNAEARYVIAAADKTFLTALISVGANLLDVSRIVHARLDASNSTGRVTNWNATTAENRIIPILLNISLKKELNIMLKIKIIKVNHSLFMHVNTMIDTL